MGICRFSRSSLLLVCMAPLTLVMITMRGLTFQPCALLASINGLYLSSFICMAWSRNPSCCEGELMIWMIRSNVGISRPFCLYMAPCMYAIRSLSIARHSRCVVLNMQHDIHGGMVSSWLPCWLMALMSVRCLVCTLNSSKLVSWWAAAFYLSILRASRYL